MDQEQITRQRLREVRKMWEAAEKESVILHASLISGGARLVYEEAPSPDDPYDTELEFCALANKIDHMVPPPEEKLDWYKVKILFSVLRKVGREERNKLKGTWPAWAASWYNWEHARCYAILALLAARPFLPFRVPERVIEPVLHAIRAS